MLELIKLLLSTLARLWGAKVDLQGLVGLLLSYRLSI